jgi:pimeloyl-ACP methyl ester carboxylesterase
MIILVFVFVFGSQASMAQNDDFVFYSDLARDWYQGGDYFEWTSTTEDNNGTRVNVFYRTWGDESNPKLVLIHGFPNSSFDYYKMIPFLEDDYHIATLDFPGSGFSDKPLDGFNYMLAENAEIVDHFVREVVGFEDFALFTHDRGVSIGLAFLGNYLDNPDPGYTVNYHFLSNSRRRAGIACLLRYLCIQPGQHIPDLCRSLFVGAAGKRSALAGEFAAQFCARGLSLGFGR